MKPFLQSRWFASLAIVVALALLAGGIEFTRVQLRAELRSQLARREGQLFASLLKQQLRASGEDVTDPLAALLETARLPEIPGVLSLGLFSTNGAFTAALPATAAEVTLAAPTLDAVRTGQVSSRFLPAADLTDEFILPPTTTGSSRPPLLEVVVPVSDLLGGGVAGFARLLLNGESLAAEYAALEASLRRQALLAFLLAGGAMTLALGFAFQRLRALNRRLTDANRELTLAAKTAAIGAVTSHLIHGLKNPLAGLQQFVKAQSGPDAAEWSDAAETTRRMKSMIDGVMRLLRDDAFPEALELRVSEVLASLEHRLARDARRKEVALEFHAGTDHPLPARDANLLSLIVENLVANAVQACTAGGTVAVSATHDAGGVCVRVRDSAGGLPGHVQQRLFTPVQSTKEGGTGLGLALSRQIALSLGASLELVTTGPTGTEFCLRLPAPAEPAVA